MAAGIFRFKKFEVRNERSAMKVNTDGVLLGAAVLLPTTGTGSSSADNGTLPELPEHGRFAVLDAGTGTGTIALMVAQRLSEAGLDFKITGIDIDADSALEAGENFAQAPWSRNLEARHIPLAGCSSSYDLIVSNPPYYDDSLQNPDARKNTARHTVAADEEGLEGAPMSWRTLLEFAEGHLRVNGTIALVLPADQEASLLRYARMHGFAPACTTRVHTTDRKPAARIVIQLARKDEALPEMSNPSTLVEGLTANRINQLIIQTHGEYSEEYRLLMKDFYLWA